MALTITNVSKAFNGKTAVDKISLIVDKPGVFGLLGTNGAGKTTTIRMILGILQSDSGEIKWNGKKVVRETANFGYLPEERGLYPKTRVSDQLIYFGKLRGMGFKCVQKSLDYWLERLKITEYKNRISEQLSKGNQQKIQLISAIIHDPDLIILDEPFNGLDPINTDLFKSVIYELIENNKFIIMSSHQMPTVEEYCQEILILKDGITILKGNLKDIKQGYGRTNLMIESTENILPYAQEYNIILKSKTPFGFEFKINSEEQGYNLLKRLLDLNIRLDKFEIREPSLHEIFIEKAGAVK